MSLHVVEEVEPQTTHRTGVLLHAGVVDQNVIVELFLVAEQLRTFRTDKCLAGGDLGRLGNIERSLGCDRDGPRLILSASLAAHHLRQDSLRLGDLGLLLLLLNLLLAAGALVVDVEVGVG